MGEGLGKGDIAGFFSGFGACEVKRLSFGIWCMQALVLTLTRRCIAWCRTHVPRRRRGCSICLSPLPSLPTHLVLAFLSSLGPCVYPCGPRACLLGCLLGIRLVCSLALHGYQGLVSCVSRSCLLLALHGYRGLVSCSLTQCTLLLNPPQHFANVAVTDLGQSCEMIRVPADLVDSGARPPVYRLLRSIVLLLCPADSLFAWSCLLACLLACLFSSTTKRLVLFRVSGVAKQRDSLNKHPFPRTSLFTGDAPDWALGVSSFFDSRSAVVGQGASHEDFSTYASKQQRVNVTCVRSCSNVGMLTCVCVCARAGTPFNVRLPYQSWLFSSPDKKLSLCSLSSVTLWASLVREQVTLEELLAQHGVAKIDFFQVSVLHQTWSLDYEAGTHVWFETMAQMRDNDTCTSLASLLL